MIQDKIILAYVAGIIDGEGTICGYSQHHKSRNNDKKFYTHHRIRIEVSNINLKLLRYLKNWFGGSISSEKSRENHQTCWHWYLDSAENQEEFLTSIFPYLLIKKTQARLGLEWCSTVHMPRQLKESHELKPGVQKIRQRIIQKLRFLNHSKNHSFRPAETKRKNNANSVEAIVQTSKE